MIKKFDIRDDFKPRLIFAGGNKCVICILIFGMNDYLCRRQYRKTNGEMIRTDHIAAQNKHDRSRFSVMPQDLYTSRKSGRGKAHFFAFLLESTHGPGRTSRTAGYSRQALRHTFPPAGNPRQALRHTFRTTGNTAQPLSIPSSSPETPPRP